MKKKDAIRYATTLTFLRIFLTVLMYPLAYYGERWMFIGVFLVACLTDTLDGWIARKYKAVTEFGAKWDTIADQFLVLSCLVFVYWLVAIDLWYYQIAFVMVLWIMLNNVYCKYKFGRLANLHLHSGKLSTFVVLVFVLWIIAFGFSKTFYWITFAVAAFAALEYSLVLTKKKIKTNTKSFF